MLSLQKELKRYRRRAQSRAPSAQAIANWFSADAEPARSGSLGFLHEYMTNSIKRERLSGPEHQIIYDELENFLSLHNAKQIPQPPTSLSPAGQAQRFVLTMIEMILTKGRRAGRDELNDFFYPSPQGFAEDHKDQSYYLLYRYSTTDGAILKSFVVIKKPQKGVSEFFSFLSFVQGGDQFLPDVIRESLGLILKFESAYYLFGYNYKIPSSRQNDPTGYDLRRLIAKSDPRALEVMTAEYSEVDLDRGLFSGLAMTMAASSQPVVSRVALLHLGTLRSLGRSISDEDVTPAELPTDKLAADLIDLIAKLNQSSPIHFPLHLERATARADWQTKGAHDLAHEIQRMIDNTPAWESAVNNPSRIKVPRGRGAIESFSKTTGTRPRP